MHRKRLIRTGSLDARAMLTAEERFWSHVEKTDTCWLWMSAMVNGYGRFKAERQTSAHRFAYELIVGPIPDGLELDHLCRVRNCVNPDHLEPVTHAENMARANPYLVDSNHHAAKTHCKWGHEFTLENTYRRGHGRVCRACKRAEAKRRWAERRLALPLSRVAPSDPERSSR